MNELPENSSNEPGDVETLDYLRGVKSSTCLLLPTTPSPTPLDFKHPLSEEMGERPFLTINDDANMANSQNSDASAGDSSSSADSNSVVQDPVSAQLINNISMLDYQTLSKNGDLILGPTEDSKLNGNVNVNNRKLPDFVNWNWRVIRKVLLWVVLSGLVACLGAIIAMVVTIPKECNPDLPWYHGKVFYEVFPASFKDSNDDGTGDLKGLVKKLDYIQSLGVTAIRLNYIFTADNYPVQYYNITSSVQLARSVGTHKDFEDLVEAVHKRNMYLILDLPVNSLVPTSSLNNHSIDRNLDETSQALAFWALNKTVDGFYLKDLENYVDDTNFGKSLQFWKFVIGSEKILIASEKAYSKAKDESLKVMMSRIDLIDVHLNMNDGINKLKNRIENVVTGTLWAKPHYPWVHWNIGDIGSERISTKHLNNTLALIALELVLPGTISIFYGDEIGLTGLSNETVEVDFHEHKDVHNLVPMKFPNNEKSDNSVVLPWNSESSSTPKYHFLDVIKTFMEVRLNTPTIYLRAIYKDGFNLKNMDIRKTDENLVVIERWYPRRNTCVFVGNLGNFPITTDLSTMFYGGMVVAGTNASLIGQVLYFDQVTFPPNSAFILKLDK
ncbi:4F2 cell-surface antigen heavy chain-like [Ostrinia nubilalis]|uniref:4F2 cell-surface antigen heavy chain-like n=1 Tax=Ostrinia nubilalis TaxID=29057 RepID=UPI0030825EA9